MANIKSQIKRIRTNEKRRLRNQAVKSELKTLVRRTRTTTKRRPDGGKKSRRTTEVVCPGPAPSPPSRPRPRPLPPGSKAIGDREPRPLGAGRNL